jgi:hypothetical protein
MPDENGGGTSARLDRIERILEQTVITVDRLADKIEYLTSETKMLLRAQVVMQERMDKWEQRQAALDERVDKLVSAIGALVARDSAK